MPGERLVRVGGNREREREREERSRGKTGEGKKKKKKKKKKKTMSRSVKAEETSPGLDLRRMITPADCIS